MKNLYFIFTLLSFSSILISCQKADDNNLIDPSEAFKSFAIGDYSQVVVDSGKAGEPLYTFTGISAKITQEVDLNKDGLDDLLLAYEPYHNLSGGQKVKITLECLNPQVGIAASAYSDSSKICYLQTTNFDSVYYNYNGTYTCQATSKNAWIPDYGYSSTFYSPDVFIVGDKPNAQMKWTTGTLLLKLEDKSADPQNRSLYQIERGQWVRAQSKYILLKQNLNGEDRYGWIKVSTNDLFEFQIEELAMEKG